MILGFSHIQKAFGSDMVLKDITFHINEKDKLAIVGVNGAGKTTLMRIITREEAPDQGDLHLAGGTSLGYMSQNLGIREDNSIYKEMQSVFQPVLLLEQELRQMEKEMSSLQGDALASQMQQYAKMQEKYEKLDAYGIESRIKGILKGIGFLPSEFDRPIKTLSGGQKTRISLGKLLLMEPDLLLLDEPTNHLDIASVEWLEDFLKAYSKTLVIISHDRFFLDKIVNKVVEVEHGKSKLYIGNYSHYREQKAADKILEEKHYEDQQKEIKRQQEVIRTLRSFNREKSIKRAESREKALNKIEVLDKPMQAPDAMRLLIEPKIQSGKDVLETEGLSLSFGNNQIFQNIEFSMQRGEKAALLGPNGIGKTSLFRIITGEYTPDAGAVKLGANVQIGYYDQEPKLNDSYTIFEEIHNAYPDLTVLEIRNVLAAFVFYGDDVYKKIASLSGGEKGRVQLAKLMLSGANFLLLDEPTNHLDIYSKEILEQAISDFSGTVLYISHDRYFINKTAEVVFDMTASGLKRYGGNYEYYLEKRQETQSLQEPSNLSEPKKDKDLWLENKEKVAAEKKAANRIKKLEEQIAQVEEQIATCQQMLQLPEYNTDPVKADEIFQEEQSLSSQLLDLMAEWESLH